MRALLTLFLLASATSFLLPGCGSPRPLPSGELVVLSESSSEASAEPNPPGEPPVAHDASTEPPLPERSERSPSDASPDAALQESPSWEPFPEPDASWDASEPTPEPTAPPEPTTEPAPDRPPLSHWIGESCSRDADCDYSGGICLGDNDGFPGGHCSLACTSVCPDRAGQPVTFCITHTSGQGRCVSQCPSASCRSGYVCETRFRHQSSRQRDVCVPKPQLPTNPKRLTFLHIGDSQSSGTRFATHMVHFLRNPYQQCGKGTTQNNTVYSYAKVSSAARHWSELSGSSKNWLCGASRVYTNGTAPQNTTGAALCAGITNASRSIFQKRIAAHKPNAFLIQLGGNSAGFSESYVKSRIQRMLDQMPSGSLCFWVTPSYSSASRLPQRRDIEKWTRQVLSAYTRLTCHVLSSIDEIAKQTTCPQFNTSDGLHMTTCGSQLWGQLISQKICALSKI